MQNIFTSLILVAALVAPFSSCKTNSESPNEPTRLKQINSPHEKILSMEDSAAFAGIITKYYNGSIGTSLAEGTPEIFAEEVQEGLVTCKPEGQNKKYCEVIVFTNDMNRLSVTTRITDTQGDASRLAGYTFPDAPGDSDFTQSLYFFMVEDSIKLVSTIGNEDHIRIQDSELVLSKTTDESAYEPIEIDELNLVRQINSKEEYTGNLSLNVLLADSCSIYGYTASRGDNILVMKTIWYLDGNFCTEESAQESLALDLTFFYDNQSSQNLININNTADRSGYLFTIQKLIEGGDTTVSLLPVRQ